MRALMTHDFGGLDSLKIAKCPSLIPQNGDVKIKVKVAGLNFFDTLIIENKYQTIPSLPFSPGAEFCGEVIGVGENVHNFTLGMRVAGYIPYGACQDEIIVNQNRLTLVPEGVSDEDAAASIVTYGTTLYALKNRAQLQPQESLLISGASGGTGLAAITLGKIMGAHVIAAASNENKLAICKEYGADSLLCYDALEGVMLKNAIKDLTQGKGVDVVYDPVGGDFAEPAIRATAWNGRYLVIGFAGGFIPKIPLNLTLLKNMALIGVFWGEFTERMPHLHQENMRFIFNLIAQKKLHIHIGERYALEDGVEAIRALKERKAVGKLIIKM